MELTFKYDLEKDSENFLKGFTAVNNPRPTKLEEEYKEKFVDLDKAKIASFLHAQCGDADAKLKEISAGWKPIEAEMFAKMDAVFSISLPCPLTAYLSTNSRCTYNVPEHYFFVYMLGSHPNGTIAHEILHFYTWYAFHAELDESRITKEKYNDIKESLTELLNIDFKDLLGGYVDKGYPQHAEMRTRVKKLREEGKSAKEIVLALNV